MDKYLKIFEPAMKKWLAEHYSPEEAKKRWERTVALDEKWIREEGDLGGRKNAMASNMLEAYAFFAFYDSVDRSFTPEDLQSMIDHVTCGAAHGKLIRHKTLAGGDGECNYWILGDREPEALADVGSK